MENEDAARNHPTAQQQPDRDDQEDRDRVAHDEPGRAGRKKRMSAAQIEANRRNALASSGPRTEAGKRRASRNAMKHGGYSNTVYPVPRGQFAEDPGEFEMSMNAIIESRRPRDAVEYATIKNIAMCFRRLERLDALEAEIIAADGRPQLQEWALAIDPSGWTEYLRATHDAIAKGSPKPPPPPVWIGTERQRLRAHHRRGGHRPLPEHRGR